MIKKIIIGLVIVLIIFGGLYFYSLSKIEVRSINFNQTRDISLSGFTLGGNLEVYNGGIIPVGIDNITYNIVLEANGEQIAQGYVQGMTISPGSTVRYPLSSKINWVPSTELALNMISGGNTYARVSGVVFLADLKIVAFKVPFQIRVDIGQYIKQYLKI